MATAFLNLDLRSARAAQSMIDSCNQLSEKQKSKAENLIRKATGIVQDNGPYAMTLFLLTRPKEEEEIAAACLMELLRLAAELIPNANVPDLRDPRSCLAFLSDKVSNDLNRLLLVKQCWEQTLIYARYTAQAVIR